MKLNIRLKDGSPFNIIQITYFISRNTRYGWNGSYLNVVLVGPFYHHHVFNIKMNSMTCTGPFNHHHAILNVFSRDANKPIRARSWPRSAWAPLSYMSLELELDSI